MQKKWLLAEAKNKFSEVLNQALKEPQLIQRRQDQVILLSRAEYERLIEIENQLAKSEDSKYPKSFKHLLMNPPRLNHDLNNYASENREDEFFTHITRNSSSMRDVDFDLNADFKSFKDNK